MSVLTDKLMELKEEEIINLYKRVFDSEDAQLMLEDLKNRCYVNVTSFTGDRQGDFNEGMRSVILHIQTQLDYKPQESE